MSTKKQILKGKTIGQARLLGSTDKNQPIQNPTTNDVPAPTTSGALKESILAALKAAGSSGLTCSELAAKLGVELKIVAIWFSTTGVKMPEIKKIAAGHFAFLPPPYIYDGEDRRPDVDYALGVAMKAAEAKGWGKHEYDFIKYANIVEFAIDDITASSPYGIKPPTVEVVEPMLDLIDWDNDLTPYPVVWHIWQDAVDEAKGQPTREQVVESKKRMLIEALKQDLQKLPIDRLSQLYVSANDHYRVIRMNRTPHSTQFSS
ncbi:MAG TPA: hypothetical protein VIM61_04735 [Chthoniobacterales bacterium]|jgi:hypothetical protein